MNEGAYARIKWPLTALLQLDPMFEPLRKDPRFQELVAPSAPKYASAAGDCITALC